MMAFYEQVDPTLCAGKKMVPWKAFFLVRGISTNICQGSLKLNSIKNGMNTKGRRNSGTQRCDVG
jgi:hypothetical protein